jgi:hypothetical protein
MPSTCKLTWFALVFFTSSFVPFFTSRVVVQALDLSKAHVCNRAMEVAQGVRTTELELDNTRLRSELEQAR